MVADRYSFGACQPDEVAARSPRLQEPRELSDRLAQRVGALGRGETKAYVNNYDLIFLAYKRELDTPAMRRAMGGAVVSGQLFIGGNTTGSPYHCAMYHNLFVQILGRKRWCFVPPWQTHYLRARISPSRFHRTLFSDRTRCIATATARSLISAECSAIP